MPDRPKENFCAQNSKCTTPLKSLSSKALSICGLSLKLFPEASVRQQDAQRGAELQGCPGQGATITTGDRAHAVPVHLADANWVWSDGVNLWGFLA